MTMDNRTRASTAAAALHAGRTTEQRSAAGRHARLAGAVTTITKRWAELTDEQRDAVRAVAAP